MQVRKSSVATKPALLLKQYKNMAATPVKDMKQTREAVRVIWKTELLSLEEKNVINWLSPSDVQSEVRSLRQN